MDHVATVNVKSSESSTNGCVWPAPHTQSNHGSPCKNIATVECMHAHTQKKTELWTGRTRVPAHPHLKRQHRGCDVHQQHEHELGGGALQEQKAKARHQDQAPTLNHFVEPIPGRTNGSQDRTEQDSVTASAYSAGTAHNRDAVVSGTTGHEH
jgi:hypothetical protein